MKFEEAYEIKPMLSKTSLRKSLTTYNILYIYRGNPEQIFCRFSVDLGSISVDLGSILCRFGVDSLSILCRFGARFSSGGLYVCVIFRSILCRFSVDLRSILGRFGVDFETFGTILSPTFLKTSLSGVVNSGLQIAFQKRAQKRLKIVF
jgi:hypothetical protein